MDDAAPGGDARDERQMGLSGPPPLRLRRTRLSASSRFLAASPPDRQNAEDQDAADHAVEQDVVAGAVRVTRVQERHQQGDRMTKHHCCSQSCSSQAPAEHHVSSQASFARSVNICSPLPSAAAMKMPRLCIRTGAAEVTGTETVPTNASCLPSGE